MKMPTSYRNIFTGLAAFAVMFILNACVNEPSPVGAGLLPGSDLMKGDTLNLSASKSFSVTSVPDSFVAWSTMAIGKTNSMEAWGVVRFDGFSRALDSITVQKAEIRMRAFYHLGDSSGQFSLAVRKILTEWRTINLTYQTVQSPGFYGPPLSTFDTLSVGDTADVIIPLDTALVSAWFRADSANPNDGVLLEPTNMNVIKGFYTPRLYLVYTLPDSVTPDTSTFTASTGDYGFVAGTSDTTFLGDSTLVHVRAGTAYRGIVSFDASALPPFSAVHRALLEVSREGTDFSSAARDSLLAIFIDDAGFVETLDAVSAVSADSGITKYTFNVTGMVQFWTQGFGIPRFGIRAYDERNAVDGFTLHGSAASAPALRPRLSIMYSSTRP